MSRVKSEKSNYIIKSNNDIDRAKSFIEVFNNSFISLLKYKETYINQKNSVFTKIIELINLYQLSQKIKINIKTS